MNKCPNCDRELTDNLGVCGYCNYSLHEGRVIRYDEMYAEKNELKCLRCNVKLFLSGNYKFHEGMRVGFLGNIFESVGNKESFDLYVCPKCGKVEFFIPKEKEY
ncbi:hypothetical protein [Prevotella sp. 10(H)]|uniref:hypothetical protein n=1 Tax=Prevotella sp. 10(H) TaxID=1158294 RepID=UPI0004A73B63|nr:hypothetical protein [Prevotella sp. 10(H)]